MVKNLIALIALNLIFSSSLVAQESDGLSLDGWISSNLDKESYPYSLIVLESGFNDKGIPVVSKVTADTIDKLSYFRLQNAKNLSWDIKLNHQKIGGMTGRSVLEKLTNASYYLFVPEAGQVVFAKREGDGTIKELFSAKSRKEQKWDVMMNWVQKKLGWDGVVLASGENNYIIGAPAGLLKEQDIQALAISGSKDKLILSKEERTGAGLLSLVKNYNGFGLFEAVFVDESTGIEAGTKLIIERRKK